MMQLPPPLAPWASLLEIFPTDLARDLGPLVQRLDLVIGPLRSRYSAGRGEPDGYDGLSRRGLYERLLISEWLLAEEMPEEFARRAAMGEHAFLKLARRERAQALSCVALFDAGPLQLGAPRLAHLATLLVLSRRAQLANARFEWGVLQDEKHWLFDEITPINIEAWLQARSVQNSSEEIVTRWREKLSAAKHDDFWLVGGQGLETLEAARGASILMADDPLEIEARTVQVQVKMAQRSAQNIVLELPEESACARLLRDPFSDSGAASRIPRKISESCAAQSNLLFADASRLIARSKEGVVVYQIPKSAKGGMPRPKRYNCDTENLVAAGMHNKAVMVAIKASDGFYLSCLNKQKSPFEAGPYSWTGLSLRNASPDLNSQLAPLFFVEGEKTMPLMWLPQAKDQCLLRFEDHTKKTEAMAFLVSRAAQFFGANLLYAVSNENSCKIIHFQTPDDFQEMRAVDYAYQVFFYAETAEPKTWLTGVLKADEWWQVFYQEKHLETAPYDAREAALAPYHNKQIDLAPPKEISVAGLVYISHKWQEPGLVCLSSDRRSIAIWGRTDKRVEWHHVLRADAEIQHITVCPTAPRIAYATAHEVAVYCLEREELLLRVRWEEV